MANQDTNVANGSQGSSYLYDYGTSPNTRTAVSQKVRILAPVFGAQTQALYQMGVVSSFSPTNSRTVEEIRGIGYGDMIAELVPSITAAVTASLERALLYLSNICQAVGYAAGVDGPVRSLAHHRWPFDIEMQLVFSSLADLDFAGATLANTGASGPRGAGSVSLGQGVQPVRYPNLANGQPATPNATAYPNPPGHSAIITMYEACWMTSWGVSGYSKDSGQIMETAEVMVSDVHDFASQYGEFLPTGNDPTAGQLGSIRYGALGGQRGGGAGAFAALG
jgi:hypothetical protein